MIRRYMDTGANADWNPHADKKRGGAGSPRTPGMTRSRSQGEGTGNRRSGSAGWEREGVAQRGRSTSQTEGGQEEDEVQRFLRGEANVSGEAPHVASSSSLAADAAAEDAAGKKIPEDTLTFEDVCYLHVVKPVDSLQLIAILYGTTSARIKDVNQLRGMSLDLDCLPPSCLLAIPIDARPETLDRCLELNKRTDFLEVYGSRLPSTFHAARQPRVKDDFEDAPFRPRKPRRNGASSSGGGAGNDSFDRMNNFESDDDLYVASPKVIEGPSNTSRAISSAGKMLSKGAKSFFKAGKGLVKRANGSAAKPHGGPIASTSTSGGSSKRKAL